MDVTVNVKNIGNLLTTLIRTIDVIGPGTKRHIELRAMLNLMKQMEIEYDIEWNSDDTKMTAITIVGQRFEI